MIMITNSTRHLTQESNERVKDFLEGFYFVVPAITNFL